MKKINNELDVLTRVGTFKERVIVDVGCGTGELVRELASRGAQVTGIDTPGMLEKAKDAGTHGNETYIPGGGESLPFKDNYADVIIYFASLHHVPPDKINRALEEAHRVIKAGGIAFCLEPVAREGSYFEVVRLVEDERDIQARAYEAIKKAKNVGLENKEEFMVYMERSYDDYVKLLNVFVEDETKRNECLAEAKKITERFSSEAGMDFEDFRFKSICRINILKKL